MTDRPSPLILHLDLQLAELRRKNALVIVEGLSREDCKIQNAESVAAEYSQVVADCDVEINRLKALLTDSGEWE